ncbi:hypothetical protein BJV77DRAFT_1012450 [Russula vinacea]|nr:hypothetical protein BJV77DRAFT_1012450 [Russula vinacea]
MPIRIQKNPSSYDRCRTSRNGGESSSVSPLPHAPAKLTNRSQPGSSVLVSTLLHSRATSAYSGTTACNPIAFGPASLPLQPLVARHRPVDRPSHGAVHTLEKPRTDQLYQTHGPPWRKNGC